MKNANQKQKFKSICRAAIPTGVFALYVVMDYLNIPQLLGMTLSEINMDFFCALLNTAVVITLYATTYYFVDGRQIQKDTNAKNTANIFMLNTYRDCLDNLSIVEDSDGVRKFIIPKVDGNKVPEDNVVIANLENFPFTSKDQILELAQGGNIEPRVLDRYLQIQRMYQRFVRMKIIFYDLTDSTIPINHQLYTKIQQLGNTLRDNLNREIERLESVCFTSGFSDNPNIFMGKTTWVGKVFGG